MKLPYASIAAKIHSNAPSRLILGQGIDDQLFWYSSEKEVLVTEYGRITKTHGLKADLLRLDLRNAPVFKTGLHKIEEPLKIQYKMDLNKKNLQNVKAEAILKREKQEIITLYDIPYQTYKISEKVNVPEINWSYENTYWVHIENGFVWKSKQYLHPKLDPIEYSVLKQYITSK